MFAMISSVACSGVYFGPSSGPSRLGGSSPGGSFPPPPPSPPPPSPPPPISAWFSSDGKTRKTGRLLPPSPPPAISVACEAPPDRLRPLARYFWVSIGSQLSSRADGTLS